MRYLSVVYYKCKNGVLGIFCVKAALKALESGSDFFENAGSG
jgi:hypothetical protein